MAKGLSRMRGNSHVRFLGGWKVVTSSGYPVPDAQRYCAKKSLASLAGCKSLSGKDEPSTRSASCAQGGVVVGNTANKMDEA
jgi:hypothetical protein